MNSVHLDPRFKKRANELTAQFQRDCAKQYEEFHNAVYGLVRELENCKGDLRQELRRDIANLHEEIKQLIEQEESNDQEETRDADGAHAEG